MSLWEEFQRYDSLPIIHFSELSLLPGILIPAMGLFYHQIQLRLPKKTFVLADQEGSNVPWKTSGLSFGIVVIIQALCSTWTSDHIAQPNDHIFFFKVIYEFYLAALPQRPSE